MEPARRTARMEAFFGSLPESGSERPVETDDTELEPPWVTISGHPAASMCWRMGGGGDVRRRFQRRYRALSESERAEFRERHPEPEGWEGWLALVESVSGGPGTPQPAIAAAAAVSPSVPLFAPFTSTTRCGKGISMPALSRASLRWVRSSLERRR